MNPNNLLYLILLFTPISNIFDYYFPVTIFGFSFWNTFIVLLAIHFLLVLSKIKRNDIIIILFFIFFAILISFVRTNIYETEFSINILSFWPLYTLLVFLIAIKKLNISAKIVSQICLIHIIFYGTIGTLYLFGLPTIEIQSEFTSLYLSDTIHRYEGIVSASNIHSNYLVTFLFIYILISHKKKFHLIILFPLAFLSIFSTASRLPLLIAFLILIHQFFKHHKILIIPVAIIFYYSALSYGLLELDLRILTNGFNDINRIEKTKLFFDLMGSNFLEILTFGVEPSFLFSDNVSISDNSFTLIFLNFGIIFFIIWMFLIKASYNSFFKYLMRNKIFFISIFLIFLLNNAILYLSWSLFIITYVHLMGLKHKSE